jgi:hypothetical protein
VPDLLLPAFALTLAVNAAFILVAIRSLRADRDGIARVTRTPDRDPGGPDARLVDGATAPMAGAANASSEPAPAAAAAEPASPSATDASIVPVPVPALDVAGGPAMADSGPRIDGEPTAAGRSTSSATQPAASTATRPRTGRRRKFSLPPLEDPEKVSRSIETFLAGGDSAASPAAVPAGDPGPLTTPAAADHPAPIVTVAAIQLLGSSSRGVLERTVRSTARGSDTVTVDRRGRVRVVLSGTGELAAHAYLRRIRAIIEPVLEAEDPTSHVVIATATELDGAVATARRRADRRLAVALRAAAADAGRALEPADGVDELDDLEVPEPRAAGD